MRSRKEGHVEPGTSMIRQDGPALHHVERLCMGETPVLWVIENRVQAGIRRWSSEP